MRAGQLVIDTEARLAELEALRGRPLEAIMRAQAPLTAAREAGGLAIVEAMLYRVIGMSHTQLGETDPALEAFAASLERARSADAEYELALTLNERTLLLESEDDAREAAEIFARLGVQSTA
jgi:tetratricopeptide (TPR) repeat protein